MRRPLFAALAALLCVAFAPAYAEQPATTSQKLTLEQIMANPDWIGPAVERPYWSADSEAIYYSLKRDGSDILDLYRVDLSSGKQGKLSDADLANADGRAVFDAAHLNAAFVRHGDVFVRDLASGKLQQITRTPEREWRIQWSADGSAVQYQRGNQWFRAAINGGTSGPVATLKDADDPQAKQPDAMQRLQLHLFKTLRHNKQEQDAQHARDLALDKADPTRSAQPFYLGKANAIVDTSLSPNGRWMLVVTQPKSHDDGKQPIVVHYVTESGYPKTEKARNYVGHNKPAAQSLVLLDLHTHQQYPLATDSLPGIHDDPLASLRAKQQAALRKAGHDDEAKALDAPKTRGVIIASYGPGMIDWSNDGNAAAVMLMSIDHKDRWIAAVDFDKHTLDNQDRLHDKAWISWSFNDFGFLEHSHTLWYLSETSGYSQLYSKAPDGKATQLTFGKFEVSAPQLSADGKWVYLVTNKQAPGDYDVYRVATSGGDLQRITHYEGMNNFEGGAPYVLSPDGNKLAILHSSAYVPPQLAVINTDGSAARELTDTRKPAYKAIKWVQPQIVKVPSSHGAGVIYAKLYKAANFDTSISHPAVFFVHGAGYLQDVTSSWSYYFREQMFNNMLTQEGYVVMDMDYRASAGYGRDWRTTIYRQMGHPELEDILDGKAWLVKTQHVDPKRVGIYGGSYGGFMAEMALLRAPGQFAAGAALRAPADWTSYNDQYTSDILNDPQLDPEAYKISSPIEYAANLQDPLLIEHGLIDNNVMPTDSIRLYQRFIELHKKDFWLSLYPMERHGFVHPDSWHDEYRRIHDLFTRFVKPVRN
ncbi:MAG: prolyl oligopeptidase family serine peptidase [Xanthomonadales bacterium]|nr:prolyl oligopeptidase family serine peptidase [Xanthomonadales bacterium]